MLREDGRLAMVVMAPDIDKPSGACLVLLMDEPFAALDALTRDEMQRLLVDVWRETRKTVIYVTHNVAEAVYLADRIVILTPHPGTVRAEVQVTLARPRDPLSVEFLDYQKRVVAHLR